MIYKFKIYNNLVNIYIYENFIYNLKYANI